MTSATLSTAKSASHLAKHEGVTEDAKAFTSITDYKAPLYTPNTQAVIPFDAFETAPVLEHPDYCEAFDLESDAREALQEEKSGEIIWSLYGHIKGEGAHHIADAGSEDAVLTLYAQITGRPKPEAGEGRQHFPPAIGIPTTVFPADKDGRAI